ncbi:MAG: hypothetical protein IJD77_00825 [Clostridia bacterium]|nr:hypothetical protein [Clostridia bacterium]
MKKLKRTKERTTDSFCAGIAMRGCAMNGKLEFLRMIADAFPGITVVEATERFSGKPIAVIVRYIILELAERKQLEVV